MSFIILGIIGIVVFALISAAFYRAAQRVDRSAGGGTLEHGKPFDGAVPGWVSLGYLLSFASVLYGLVRILISN